MAEYISDLTGAHITALDTSSVGIHQALERTAAKRDRLIGAEAHQPYVDSSRSRRYLYRIMPP